MSRGEDTKWMRECFRLAQKGAGYVSPNPLVGAVIVRNGKLLGKGFHKKYGEAHAEVNAIKNALRTRSNITGATLYVNLEPCVHYGKTPPCVKAIVNSGITKVVAAMKDPNPLVGGKGFTFLRRSGVKVVTNVLRAEAVKLNEKFLKYISTGAPFVALKVAQTADGFIARPDGSSKWITSKSSRRLAHRFRSEYDAVLVGAGTAIMDNPQLNVRHVAGKDPVRVLIDGKLRTPLTATMFNDKNRSHTIVFTALKKETGTITSLRKKGVRVRLMKGKNGIIPIKNVLGELAKSGVASLLVEGGQSVYRQLLNGGLADKVYLFVSPKRFRAGVSAFSGASFGINRKTVKRIGKDLLIEGNIHYRKGA